MYSLERKGGTLILHMSEELDHHMANQVSRTVDTQIEKGDVRVLIFDFEGMTFMDSSGIGMVLGAQPENGVFRRKNICNRNQSVSGPDFFHVGTVPHHIKIPGKERSI